MNWELQGEGQRALVQSPRKMWAGAAAGADPGLGSLGLRIRSSFRRD